MMALIDDNMTVIANIVFDDTIADQTLDNRNIQLPVGLRRPPPTRPISRLLMFRNVDSRSTH
jgi:hypothetical protein